MNDAHRRAGGTRRVEIRILEVITGPGRSLVLPTVRCPERARTAVVEECAHCGQSGGIAQDVPAPGAWVSCDGRRLAARPGEETPVRLALRRRGVAVRPGVPAAAAAAALRARGEPGAPVVDGEGRPLGWVGEAELLRASAGAKVSDAMTRVALAVAEDAPLGRAAALLAAHDVERLAVVSADGIVVGVLSALDVVAWGAAPMGRVRG